MISKLKQMGSKGATGGKQAVGWVMVLFLVALLGGSMLYVLVQFNTSITDATAQGLISDFVEIFDLIPTWVEILVIVGFAGAIALVGLMIYRVFEGRSRGM